MRVCKWRGVKWSVARCVSAVGAAVWGLPQTPYWPTAGAPEVGDEVYEVGLISPDAGDELSGVVMSRARVNWFWTHSDGDRSKIYAFADSGALLATVKIEGFKPTDVEDIAADNAGNLYLSDTGDNGESRAEVSVVRFPEPPLGATKQTVTRTWRLRWPNGARDAEGLVVDSDHGWLVARIRADGEPSSLMRFRLDSTAAIQTLEFVGDLPVYDPIAGADLTPDGRQFAVTTKKGAYVWQVNGDLSLATTTWPTYGFNATDTQKEGACFVPQGLLVIAETHEMYLYAGAAFRPESWRLQLNRILSSSATVSLDWQATVGVACTLEVTGDLASGQWQPLAPPLPGLGTASHFETNRTASPAFFRIRAQP